MIKEIYDPQEFAAWLRDAFMQSSFKSWQQVARAVEETGITTASRSTLSRYAGAKPQSLTGKPSQPQPELAQALAKVFDADVNYVLQLSGHAPAKSFLPNVFQGLNLEVLSEKELLEIREFIEMKIKLSEKKKQLSIETLASMTAEDWEKEGFPSMQFDSSKGYKSKSMTEKKER